MTFLKFRDHNELSWIIPAKETSELSRSSSLTRKAILPISFLELIGAVNLQRI
jgi:hypothetical protein